MASCSLLVVKRIGVVVPTLFTRFDYLKQCLESIRAAGSCHVIVMGPDIEMNARPYVSLVDQLIEEPTEGTLSAKLSFALQSFPNYVELITWIGDDDILAPGSLEALQREFEIDSNLALIYGACDYIDSSGERLGSNRSGPWALKLAKVGPFLAPQPGSLFDRKAFETLGGLDSSLGLAFDFDLFLSLAKLGGVKYLNKTLASFRWHENSLSVAQRKLSVREASIVRQKHASPGLKILLQILNPIVELVTFVAGSFLNMRFKTRVTK